MDDSVDKPWLRKKDETSVAYAAFRTYMDVRTLQKTCEETGKSWQLISKWSSMHSWVERVRAFDSYLSEASTDGMVHQLAESRDKNLALMDKLRGLLDSRLDTFIAKNMDPTVAWTKAVEAMARVEANSLLLGKDSAKASEGVERVEKIIARLEERVDQG